MFAPEEHESNDRDRAVSGRQIRSAQKPKTKFMMMMYYGCYANIPYDQSGWEQHVDGSGGDDGGGGN